MTSRNLSQLQKLKIGLKLTNTSVDKVLYKIKNFETPQRLKGTFLERWGKYWKNLYLEYKTVAIDVAKDCREKPVKASIYASLFAASYYLCKHNPDEYSFRDELLQDTMKVIQVGDPIQNPVSVHHVKWLEQCYNEGIVRRLNLGILSLIWLDNYDKACSLYKATCPYLKPRYLTFYERVVDVGFLGRWWILDDKMKDYDVNEAEFTNVQL